MEFATNLDRIRAWVEGRLPPAEAARLERDLARQPELAELAERFRDVHALTAAEPEPPACRVTFADLERRLASETAARRARWPRRAAAAAVLLFGGATATWMVWDGPSRPGTDVDPAANLAAQAQPERVDPTTPTETHGAGRVELAAIRFEPEAVKPYDYEVPQALASFDPRGEDGIQWLETWEEAFFASRASGRPVLVFGSLPSCPWCAELELEVLSRPEVLGLIDRYVPMQWNLGALDPEESARVQDMRGYPLFEVWTGEDQFVLNFSGRPDVSTFEEMMHQGLEGAGATGELPPWDEVRDLAQRYERARAVEDEGRMADAQTLLRALHRRDETGAYGEAASKGLDRIARAAAGALETARRTAADDPAEARANLEQAARSFAGTAFEADLRAVLEAWPQDGEFPELVDSVGS